MSNKALSALAVLISSCTLAGVLAAADPEPTSSCRRMTAGSCARSTPTVP